MSIFESRSPIAGEHEGMVLKSRVRLLRTHIWCQLAASLEWKHDWESLQFSEMKVDFIDGDGVAIQDISVQTPKVFSYRLS